MAQLRPDLDVNQIISVFIIKAGILLLSPRKVFFSVGWTRDSRWAATQEQQGLKEMDFEVVMVI